MYYIYILKCEGNRLYTGITTDIKRRYEEHSSQNGKGAKFTRSHKAENIEAVWSAENRSLASRLEWKIKKLRHLQKIDLIRDNSIFSSLFGKEAENIYKRESLSNFI